MSDNHRLVEAILKQLNDNLLEAQAAADEARHAATHEESVAETQYDTLGLEASYLAEGQSRRVADIQEAITQYHQLPHTTFGEDSPITLGARVTLAQDGTHKHLFLGPAGGGLEAPDGDVLVTVVTPAAPLGAELIQKYVGDEVHLGQQIWEIVAVS